MKKNSVIYAILLIISLVLVFGSKESQINKAKITSKYVIFPFVNTINYFRMLKIRDQEISYLRTELNSEKQKSNILKTELIKLSSELKLQDNYITLVDSLTNKRKYVSAKIISNSFSYSNKILIIDKGIRDGIKINDAVVCSEGIVGKIISVNYSTSEVLPFVNIKSRLSIMNDNNVQGILESEYSGYVKMSFIEKNSSIANGDTLYTSNLSQIYKHYFSPVGIVDSVKLAISELYLEAYFTPFTEINNLSNVFIIK